MRRFSSYGPPDKDAHYYAPREELIKQAYIQLVGENPDEGGQYITVWAPRQTGKSWLMVQIFLQLKNNKQFDVVPIPLEHLKDENNVGEIINTIAEEIGKGIGKEFSAIDTQKKFQSIFAKKVLKRPLILILDEFDSLTEEAINTIASTFRNIYNRRVYEADKPTGEKSYLLHGVALIGIRSVLGIENVKGSPFNVQRSLQVPNLDYDEVESMFKWYRQESGQEVEPAAVRKLYDETRGQPGLTCWFGELLTETYNKDKDRPISLAHFEEVYAMALSLLPNSNILNIISKAKKEPYKQLVLDMFRTDELLVFKFNEPHFNYLYMNGIIEPHKTGNSSYYARFANPFVQEQLFTYFSSEMFNYMGKLVEPFDRLDDVITADSLNTANLVKRYQSYLNKNREWLLRDVPRRKDLRIYEAVFHFNLYMFLSRFLENKKGRVIPQFPTGNGKIDLIITYEEQVYGIELKTYRDFSSYNSALKQAALYGKQLDLKEILLVFFVDTIDEKSRKMYESDYKDENTGVKVTPIFVKTAD